MALWWMSIDLCCSEAILLPPYNDWCFPLRIIWRHGQQTRLWLVIADQRYSWLFCSFGYLGFASRDLVVGEGGHSCREYNSSTAIFNIRTRNIKGLWTCLIYYSLRKPFCMFFPRIITFFPISQTPRAGKTLNSIFYACMKDNYTELSYSSDFGYFLLEGKPVQ